jgi:hypothetical protein
MGSNAHDSWSAELIAVHWFVLIGSTAELDERYALNTIFEVESYIGALDLAKRIDQEKIFAKSIEILHSTSLLLAMLPALPSSHLVKRWRSSMFVWNCTRCASSTA